MNQWFNTQSAEVAGTAQNARNWHYFNTGSTSYFPNLVGLTPVGNVTFPGTFNSASCSITIPTKATHAEKLSETGALSLFPNPTYSNLFIDVPEKEIGKTCSIFSSDGKLVKSFTITSSQTQIEVETWTIGIYLVEINGATSRFIKK